MQQDFLWVVLVVGSTFYYQIYAMTPTGYQRADVDSHRYKGENIMQKVLATKINTVGYLNDLNDSRRNPNYVDWDPKRTELMISEARHGWKPDAVVHIYNHTSPIFSEDLIDQVMANLEKQLETLQTAPDMKVKNPFDDGTIVLSKADQQAGFLNHYGDGKKLIRPKALAVSGYRRNSVGWVANAVRLKENMKPFTEMQTILDVYKDRLALQMACIMENVGQQLGVVTLGVADKLHASRLMFHQGCSQKAMRDLFKDGMGQKLYELNWIDNNFGTDFIDVCLKDPTKFGPLKPTKMREFRTAFQTVRDFDQGLVEIDGEDVTEETIQQARAKATKESVQAYFRKPKTGKNDPKVAAKDAVLKLEEQSPVEIIREVVRAYKLNDLERLNKYIPYAKAINEAIENIMADAGIKVAASSTEKKVKGKTK